MADPATTTAGLAIGLGAARSAQKLIEAVCTPAANEAGLWLQDKIRSWRARNLHQTLEKFRGFVTVDEHGVQLKAHPRTVLEWIEHASKVDDPLLQEKWAGLLASSCTPSGEDQSNLIFIDLLQRLTPAQARLLDYACQHSEKGVYAEDELAFAYPFGLTYPQLTSISGSQHVHQLDVEIQHLKSLRLLRGDISADTLHETKPVMRKLHQLTPDRIGLQFYVRCQGSRSTPKEYFKILKVCAGGPYSATVPEHIARQITH